METTNRIIMRADVEEIFELAARVEDWGDLLPHYRYVKLLYRRGNTKWVRMSAWRSMIPVTWTAVCTIEQGTKAHPGRIRFRHIRGLVRGMDVEWWFDPEPDGDGVVVGISHKLDNPPFPTRILGPKLLETVVGEGFIGYIASKTLRRMKNIVEQPSGDAISSTGRLPSLVE